MDDRTELQRDATLEGSPGDRDRASDQVRHIERATAGPDVERVDSLGRPLPAGSDLPAHRAEAQPPPDQQDVRPTERSIGENVRAQSQNGQGTTR